MALIFIFVMSVIIWLYCPGGFKVVGDIRFACLVGLWLCFCSEPYGGTSCLLRGSGRNRCYVKRI